MAMENPQALMAKGELTALSSPGAQGKISDTNIWRKNSVVELLPLD
jgi:hypothetical protein